MEKIISELEYTQEDFVQMARRGRNNKVRIIQPSALYYYIIQRNYTILYKTIQYYTIHAIIIQ